MDGIATRRLVLVSATQTAAALARSHVTLLYLVGVVFFIVHSTGTPRVPAAGSRDIQYIYPAQRRFSAEIPKLIDAAGDQGGTPDHEDL